MRKALGCLILLLLVGCGSVAAIGMEVFGARDQVTFTGTVHQGDPSMVEDITLNIRSRFGNHLFWDTTYEAGVKPVANTEYLFSVKDYYELEEYRYPGVSTYTAYGLDAPEESSWGALTKRYNQLIEDATPGVENKAKFYLKDYIEYYPVHVMIELPGNNMAWAGDFYSDLGTTPVEPGTEMYVIQKFQEFFKIPVLENEQMEIGVEVDAEGNVYSQSIDSGINETFYMNTFSVVAPDACYFTFDPGYVDNGHPVDTSQIPGGYGIYRLPYEESYVDEHGQRKTGIKAEELAMVYPMEDELQITYLALDPAQTELQLHTVEQGDYMLTIIDLATMETKQKIKVMDWPAEDWFFYSVFEGEDYIAICMNNYKVTVLEKVDGMYQQQFMVDTPQAGDKSYLSDLADVDYDGERLVLADFAEGMYDSTHFYVMVYDATGLVYHATYASSLNAGDSSNRYAYHCRPADREPLTVKWEE